MVLRRGADHRRAADIDVLDAVVEVGAARDGFLERIEIDHQKIDRADVVRAHRLGVRGVVADAEQAAMHRRMQRLDPAVHHFGKAGEIADVEHLEPGIAQRLAGAAGRNELDAVAGERAGEFDEPGFVGDGNEGARRAAQVFGHGFSSVMLRAGGAVSIRRCLTDGSSFVILVARSSGRCRPRQLRLFGASAAARSLDVALLQAPDHARRVARLAVDDDLHGAPRAFGAGQIDAVLELDAAARRR